MAAGAWTFYNTGKLYIGTGDIDLDTANFRIRLFTSASNAATATLSTIGSVTSEVSGVNGYGQSGKQLTGVTWAAGASASEFRFDCTAVIWSASGGTISAVKFAVIHVSAGAAAARKLLCYSQLSTSQFDITDTNTLTVTPSANGIFELN